MPASVPGKKLLVDLFGGVGWKKMGDEREEQQHHNSPRELAKHRGFSSSVPIRAKHQAAVVFERQVCNGATAADTRCQQEPGRVFVVQGAPLDKDIAVLTQRDKQEAVWRRYGLPLW